MGRHGGSHRWHVQDRSPHGAQGRGGLPQGAPSLQLGRRRHCAPWGRSSFPIAGVGKASRFTARWLASRCGDPFRCWTTGGRVYWRKRGRAPDAEAPTRGHTRETTAYKTDNRPATMPCSRAVRAETGTSAPQGATRTTTGGNTGRAGSGNKPNGSTTTATRTGEGPRGAATGTTEEQTTHTGHLQEKRESATAGPAGGWPIRPRARKPKPLPERRAVAAAPRSAAQPSEAGAVAGRFRRPYTRRPSRLAPRGKMGKAASYS